METGSKVISHSAYTTKTKYIGFGGWLFLFSIGQIITLYISIYNIFYDVIPVIQSEQWKSLTKKSPSFQTLIYIELIGAIIIIILAAFIIYMTFSRNKHYVNTQITYIFIYLLIGIAIASTSNEINHEIQEIVYPEPFRTIPSSLIAGAVWIAYFIKSKRVANTFNG